MVGRPYCGISLYHACPSSCIALQPSCGFSSCNAILMLPLLFVINRASLISQLLSGTLLRDSTDYPCCLLYNGWVKFNHRSLAQRYPSYFPCSLRCLYITLFSVSHSLSIDTKSSPIRLKLVFIRYQ